MFLTKYVFSRCGGGCDLGAGEPEHEAGGPAADMQDAAADSRSSAEAPGGGAATAPSTSRPRPPLPQQDHGRPPGALEPQHPRGELPLPPSSLPTLPIPLPSSC